MKIQFKFLLLMSLLISFNILSSNGTGLFYDLSVGYGKLVDDQTSSYKFRVSNYINDDLNLSVGLSQNNRGSIDDDFFNYFSELNKINKLTDDLTLSYGPGLHYSDLNNNVVPALNLRITNHLSSRIGLFTELTTFYSYAGNNDVSYLLNLGVSWFSESKKSKTRISDINKEYMALKSYKENKQNEILKDVKIKNLFDNNSSYIIRPKKLDSIIHYLKLNNELIVNITNLNSYDGDELYNTWLADRRISRIKKYFVSQGINENRLEFENVWDKKLNTKDRVLIFKYYK